MFMIHLENVIKGAKIASLEYYIIRSLAEIIRFYFKLQVGFKNFDLLLNFTGKKMEYLRSFFRIIKSLGFRDIENLV